MKETTTTIERPRDVVTAMGTTLSGLLRGDCPLEMAQKRVNVAHAYARVLDRIVRYGRHDPATGRYDLPW